MFKIVGQTALGYHKIMDESHPEIKTPYALASSLPVAIHIVRLLNGEEEGENPKKAVYRG